MPLRTILITATRSGTASTVIIRRGASGTGTGGGVTDHGELGGLLDSDDHTQYFNQERGDARYATTSALAGKASLAATNNFTATQTFAQPVYLSGAVMGTVTTPIAGAYNGPGTGLTGTAQDLIVGQAFTANALTSVLPIISGGTGGATQSAAWTGLGGGGTIVSPVFTNITIGGGTAITTSGTTGAALVEAGNPAAALAILGIQSKTGTSTGLAAVGVSDITGLTGYTLEASTWYKLELHYLWTSTSSNFQINFVTTGTFERGATTPALGQSMSATTVISTTFFPASDSTYFSLRGSVGENRNNVGFFGYAYFKTGTSGTGKIQLQLLSGTTLSTINSAKAVLTKL